MLLVPIHLDALILDEDKMAVEAMADFSRLPYSDGTAFINEVANISEEILSPPFQNENLLLKPGIYLHWSLPDALTRARHLPHGQEFPPVPNRWLITRCDDNGNVQKEWIVESDYLYPVKPAADPDGISEESEDPSGTSVTIPYRRDHDTQPFRYMGRRMELEEWQKETSAAEYYPKLTAVGYGEPTFAAFYPNCHSVFGFFDPERTANSTGGRYDLIGWYSDPGQDYLGEFIRTLPGTVNTNEARMKALEDDFKWTVNPDQRNEDLPGKMLCYASLVVGEDGEPNLDETVAIAVGNTGTEALSAYVADTLEGSKTIIEDQLEALGLSSKLEHRQLDIGPKFLEARHEKGFTALPGGSLWTIRPESPTTAAADAGDQDAGISLPDEIAELLNVANDFQQEYDRAWQEIESLRRQLFSDWYKYMLCEYRWKVDYPNVDEVKSYIEQNVDSLNARIGQTGVMLVKDDGGTIIASVDSPGAGARDLVEAINNLQEAVDAHNQGLQNPSTAYRLRQVSGPRYWRPNEPVVLMVGAIVKASERHGHYERPSDGLLETRILDWEPTDLPGDENLRSRIRTAIADLESPENFAFSNWSAQPWNPFLLEWEVEVFPVVNKANIEASGRYSPDFISDNYTVSENQVDLSFQEQKGTTTKGANVYSGRSILTPHASIQLKKQIEAFLNQEILPKYYQAEGSPLTKQDTAYLDQNIDAIQKWYEETNASSLTSTESKTEDAVYTAIRAWKALQGLDCLSQSLGGFNEALLMHKQTLQLAIGDPLGFEDDQKFAQTVKDAVSSSIYSAPEPLNDFNPIRAGAMTVSQLRLVDTFGQFKDLEITRVITSELMTNSDTEFHVRLAPRLVQPARINFRWLAAESDEQEMNDHPATTPICGWVLTNNLDNRLMIHDNQGKALGSLVMKETDPAQPTWEPAPGGGPYAVVRIDGIPNPHLKKMVANIQKYGATFLNDFISAVDKAMENIEPENFAQHQALALLMGRPIALVRAVVNLELQGLPAIDQSWPDFSQDLERETRDDNGLSQVQFPIRIGEYEQFNDGTVGYWIEKKGDSYEGDVFYAPQSDDEVQYTDSHLKTHKHDPMTIFQSVKSEPHILSLLLDPRGLVHATSGVLPAKAIRIPPDQYADALQAIEITFLSTPILTEVGKIHLPLPAEPGYQWSWLQQDGQGTWTERSTRGLIQKNSFDGFQNDVDVVWNELIKQGWIESDPNNPARASVKAKNLRKTLADNLKDKTAEIEDILDRVHVGPINPGAKFSAPQEIREGWLKLSVDATANPEG